MRLVGMRNKFLCEFLNENYPQSEGVIGNDGDFSLNRALQQYIKYKATTEFSRLNRAASASTGAESKPMNERGKRAREIDIPRLYSNYSFKHLFSLLSRKIVRTCFIIRINNVAAYLFPRNC